MQKTFLNILFVCLLGLVGCVSVPDERLSHAIETCELSDHVEFLAQPGLKGRKPKSWESVTARKYLKDRFQAYGLLPWSSAKGYEQSFGFGTNVIGVLPGGDPALADEIVILSAHYDHVGKTKQGVLLGACDNASAVAVLLEIAEQLSLDKNRPRRSVCFASFDCEERMLLGSFAFTCRDDFDKQKIAAVVNVDLLGRDFLEVVDGSLFVVGTQLYPLLQSQILQAGSKTELKILPVGTDMVGPRGDHAAFETMDMPVLFFTCGLYKDYHKPTDTADKLDYAKITQSAQVVLKAVEILANSDNIENPTPLTNGSKDELLSIKHILEQVSSNHKELKLDPNGVEELRRLTKETQKLLDDGQYTVRQRRRFTKKALKALLPAMATADEALAKADDRLLMMNELYTEHSELLLEWYRDMVKQMLKNKPGPFDKIRFKYQAYDLPDENISLVEKEDGQHELDAILTELNLNYGTWGLLFKKPYLSLWANYRTEFVSGTKDDLTDYCLLLWRKKISEDSYDESYAKTRVKVLNVITDQNPGEQYNDWLEWRLENLGLTDEKQWLLGMSQSEKPLFAINALNEIDPSKVCELIKDTNAPVLKRDNALWKLQNNAGKEGLLTLVDVLADQTPLGLSKGQPRELMESYPFADHRFVKWFRESMAKQDEQKKETQRTIGSDAETKLKILTQQDFGKDAGAWRKWIEKKYKNNKGS
ncbi:M28 family peptidase [Planctomycetota bacterium]